MMITNIYTIFDKGIPDVFDRFGLKVKEYYGYFKEKTQTYTYRGIPVVYLQLFVA